MTWAQKKNVSMGISGIIMYSDGNFFQIIEGEEQEVKKVFNKVQQDPRHYNLIKLVDKKD